jgi:hypothetical protein
MNERQRQFVDLPNFEFRAPGGTSPEGMEVVASLLQMIEGAKCAPADRQTLSELQRKARGVRRRLQGGFERRGQHHLIPRSWRSTGANPTRSSPGLVLIDGDRFRLELAEDRGRVQALRLADLHKLEDRNAAEKAERAARSRSRRWRPPTFAEVCDPWRPFR